MMDLFQNSFQKTWALTPPHGFKIAGEVTNVTALDRRPGFAGRKQRYSGAAKAGLAYERKVQERLGEAHGISYVPGQWFVFRSKDYSGTRFAQPDGLYFDFPRGRLVVVEIKIKHVTRAWWQLRTLYEPVLSFVFPDWDVTVVEVYNRYDVSEEIPEKIQYVENISQTSTKYNMLRMVL